MHWVKQQVDKHGPRTHGAPNLRETRDTSEMMTQVPVLRGKPGMGAKESGLLIGVKQEVVLWVCFLEAVVSKLCCA